MTILKKQTVENQDRFAGLVALLIIHARDAGYQVTLGDAYRDKRCSYGVKGSYHRKRLAIDLNLFKDGKYLPTTSDHEFLGKFWLSLDPYCTWGGDWNDGNHYSYLEGV